MRYFLLLTLFATGYTIPLNPTGFFEDKTPMDVHERKVYKGFTERLDVKQDYFFLEQDIYESMYGVYK